VARSGRFPDCYNRHALICYLERSVARLFEPMLDKCRISRSVARNCNKKLSYYLVTLPNGTLFLSVWLFPQDNNLAIGLSQYPFKKGRGTHVNGREEFKFWESTSTTPPEEGGGREVPKMVYYKLVRVEFR
jgi:hypothetical protein